LAESYVFFLVEARGVEPLSEGTFRKLSPSAVADLHSPMVGSRRQDPGRVAS